jgi:hypothetical protein
MTSHVFNVNLSDDDETGSAMGMDLLINKKRVNSVDGGSLKSFDASIDIEDAFQDDGGGGLRVEVGANNNMSDSISTITASSKSSRKRHGGQPQKSHNDIINMKKELLYQFSRLEKKGIHVPKHFTMSSSLDEMKAEFDRIKRDVDMDSSVRFQRKMLMACVSGIEFLNTKFDPFDIYLDGWSESVQDGINDYDDIFEELWVKYHGRVKMAPELRLMLSLGGSAVWFHMSHAMFKNMPGVEQVFNANPELKKQFMSATMKTAMQQQSSAAAPPRNSKGGSGNGGGGAGGGLFSGLGGLMGGLFGGGGAGGGGMEMPAAPGTPRQRGTMKGPSNVDDLLNELNDEHFGTNANETFEIFSNASGSDIGSIDEILETGTRRRTMRI